MAEVTSCLRFGCRTPECCGRGYKYMWPELVGMDGHKAKAIIEKENPLVSVEFARKGFGWFFDFCCNRVYVFLDEHLKVASDPSIPQIG